MKDVALNMPRTWNKSYFYILTDVEPITFRVPVGCTLKSLNCWELQSTLRFPINKKDAELTWGGGGGDSLVKSTGMLVGLI